MKVLIKLLFQRKSPWEREKCKFSQSHLSLGSIATKNMSKHKSYGRDSSSKIKQSQGEITRDIH